VVLDRPARANAITPTMLSELDHATAAIEADDAICVWLLAGATRADGRAWFSSGLDLEGALSTAGAAPFDARALAPELIQAAQTRPPDFARAVTWLLEQSDGTVGRRVLSCPSTTCARAARCDSRASRSPVGAPSTAQQNRSVSPISGP
jgi:hypothetical protein